jgi:hypothetical protein
MRYAPAILFTVGIGGAAGVAFWVCAGQPVGFLECAIASGIATCAIFMAGGLWKLRAAVRAGDETPEDRPRLELLPGTSEERRADLFALWDGRLSLEEFVDRWSGREIVSDSQAAALEKYRNDVEAAIKAELARPTDPAEPELFPCKHCLGLHTGWEKCSIVEKTMESRGDVSEYVTLEELENDEKRSEPLDLIAASPFRAGQWVRVRAGATEPILVHLIKAHVAARMVVWTFLSDQGEESLAEACFEFAYPKKDEVWEDIYCARHSPLAKGYPPRVFTVEMDWAKDCLGTAYLACGCIRPVNFGHGVVTLDTDWPETMARMPCGCFYRLGKQG